MTYAPSRAYAVSRAYTGTRHFWPAMPEDGSVAGGGSNLGTGNTLTTLTVAARGTPMLAVLVAEYAATTKITGITQNGVALTKIGEATNGSQVGSAWYLANPTSGNLVYTASGGSGIGYAYTAQVGYYASQAAPMMASHVSNGYAPSVSLSGVDLAIVDLLALTGAPVVDSTAAGQTRLRVTTGDVGSNHDYESVLISTSDPQTVGWTVDSEYDAPHVYVAMAFKPFGG